MFQQLFYNLYRSFIQGRGGLIQQQNLGLEHQGSGQTESLLLPSGKKTCILHEPVLDLVPQKGLLKGPPYFLPDGLLIFFSGKPEWKGNIFENTYRQWIGCLKHHAHTFSKQRQRITCLKNIFKSAAKINLHLSLNPCPVYIFRKEDFPWPDGPVIEVMVCS